MNSNTVLGKIMTLLSLDREEVILAIARLADGTILESETFDVGEKVEVVSEDGTKSAAPDGEHELELTDESGNKETFKIIVKDGLISERENVELEEETEEVEDIPATGGTIPDDTELAEEEVEEEVVEEESDTIDLAEVGKKVEELGYRIAELEKKLEAAEEVEEEEEELEDHIEEEEIEMQSKKLTGAPVESLFNKQRKENKSTIPNYHSSVLGKMYRN
jgi:ATP-dependent Clp protease ATP-binding subunit ClpA